MKIDKKVGPSLTTDSASGIKSSALNDSKKAKEKTDLFSSSLGSSARVDLSERAQDAKKAKEIAQKGLNDVDEAKVAKFQALIDGGKYQVNAAKVADRMIDEHLANEFAAGEAKD